MLYYSWPSDSFPGPSNSLGGNFAKVDGDTWRKQTCAFDDRSGRVVIFSVKKKSWYLTLQNSRIRPAFTAGLVSTYRIHTQ